MCSPLSVVHGSDPDHEGWTRSRYEGGAEKSLAGSLRGSSPVKSAHTQGAHILEHTVRAEELSCSSVPGALSTLCFFARVLLHSFFFVCLFGWFFLIINHIIFHVGAESVATVCLFRTSSRIFGISFRIKVDT